MFCPGLQDSQLVTRDTHVPKQRIATTSVVYRDAANAHPHDLVYPETALRNVGRPSLHKANRRVPGPLQGRPARVSAIWRSDDGDRCGLRFRTQLSRAAACIVLPGADGNARLMQCAGEHALHIDGDAIFACYSQEHLIVARYSASTGLVQLLHDCFCGLGPSKRLNSRHVAR